MGTEATGTIYQSRNFRRSLFLKVVQFSIFFPGLIFLFNNLSASTLKSDEKIIFFPTSASLNIEKNVWSIPIHGWIFEPEEDSIWRSVLVNELHEWFELPSESIDEKIFRDRAGMFIVDNERGKQFSILAGGQSFITEHSGPDGHFRQRVELDHILLGDLAPGAWVQFEIDPTQTTGRRSGGRVQLVSPEGLSVISDIDDTIKVSGVLDKKELLENTFLKEFKPVPGMSELYRGWAEAGTVFHYVSASPWQLYPSLEKLLSTERFPDGSISLRSFRFKDRTFFNLFSSPEENKIPVIETILSRYPSRQFILVGDSGEKDPEIYGEVARLHPDQVVHICIRNVPDSDASSDRYRAAFKSLEENRWTVFSDPEELGGINLELRVEN